MTTVFALPWIAMSRYSRSFGVVLLLLVLAWPSLGRAGSTPKGESDSVMRGMFDTSLEVLAAPADWTAKESWEAVATAGVVVALIESGADASLSRSLSSPASAFGEDVSKFGKALGEPLLNLGTLSVFGVYGWLADDADARLTFESGFLAGALTEVVVEALKIVAGRARPNAGLGAEHFRPFSGSASLPSGHTAFAFSLAGTVNYFYPGLPGIAAMLLAGTTAYSRVHTLNHFPSDVVLGGVIGAAVSRAVAKRWDRRRRGAFEVVPTYDENGAGAAVRHHF